MLRKTLHQSFLINFVRNYRRKIGNPGIEYRKATMQNLEKDMNFEDVDFDDFESDFMNVHQSHKECIKEQAAMKEKLKYQIVKQKYFSQKHPNFLTWNDKQQIKYLYTTNSEEWTIEKLSESFPALPEVIEKIIRNNFSKNESKVKNHDAAVQRNWIAFKKCELTNLPEKLTEHLKKFSDRSLNFTSFKNPEKVEVVKKPNIPTEFSDIITSYDNFKNKIENKSECIKMNEEIHPGHHFSTLNQGINNNEKISQILERNVTLQELKNEIEQGIVSGKEIPVNEKMIFDSLSDTKKEHNVMQLKKDEVNSIMETTKYQTSGALVKKTERDYSHLIYPERIRIPKGKFRYGCTYKLNDCYYDSDGRFLYRVPGMV